ncbi:hypothetical protein HK100_007353 [Physocladia obscura]|uniref:FAD-binding domain-containing protein n=1 Tax=Physocladia obscura TaxID=109957 RepID=A0AAD5XIA7_9FUNG|nr:hypothetical protein HK100_007353 [Physocladia obscura]
MPKVIIIGAGLVGTSMAVALQKQGFEVSVYDKIEVSAEVSKGKRYLEFGETGGSLGIQANGMLVLDRLELLDKVLEQPHTLLEGMTFLNADGSDPVFRSTISNNLPDRFKKDVHLMRSHLQNVIMRKCGESGVRMFINMKLESFSQTDSEVTVKFSDGTTVTGDYLVGADGIHSNVRRILFPEHPKAEYFCGGYLGVFQHGKKVGDATLQLKYPLSIYMNGLTGSAVFAARVGDSLGAWNVLLAKSHDGDASANAANDDWRPAANLPQEAARLADLVKEWQSPPNLVDAVLHADRITPINVYDLPNLPKWHKGRVLLAGDSAHGMLPSFGHGLGQGLEDVSVLADLFAELGGVYADHRKVFELYDKIRIPRAHSVANTSRNASSTTFTNSKLREKVMRTMMKFAFWLSNVLKLNDVVGAHDVRLDVKKALAAENIIIAK